MKSLREAWSSSSRVRPSHNQPEVDADADADAGSGWADCQALTDRTSSSSRETMGWERQGRLTDRTW